MAEKKKLQIFVSSTREDLKSERQAAVEAILTAGHIPAGMELFASGDESQMNVIKRWIDESDVYLLILGGRYGSIETKSGKSYTHLEYEYAIAQGKPYFAVVITDEHLDAKVKEFGKSVLEQENPQKLKAFRADVKCRIVKFWNDPRDIKLAILETMRDFSDRDDLKGWIPGEESINTGVLAEEIARLGKENAELREQNLKLSANSATSLIPSVLYNGLTFDEMFALLAKRQVNKQELDEFDAPVLEVLRESVEHIDINCLHVFWLMTQELRDENVFYHELRFSEEIKTLLNFKLVAKDRYGNLSLTEAGQQFMLRFQLTFGEASVIIQNNPKTNVP